MQYFPTLSIMSIKFNGFVAVNVVLTSLAAWESRAEVGFESHVKPILEAACIGCHGPDEDKGDLRLDTWEHVLAGGEYGDVIVAGNPDESTLYTLTTLPADDDDVMPPDGENLASEQIEVLKQWIADGAKWPEGAVLTQKQRIEFVEDVQPILEFNCVSCHREGHEDGGLSLSTREAAFSEGDSGVSIIRFDPEESLLYSLTVLPPDDDDIMPPEDKGEPLSSAETDTLRAWIQQGAVWPEGVELVARKKVEGEGDGEPKLAEIHARVVASNTVAEAADMKAYSDAIPKSRAKFEMVPIPGGEFVMGSPIGEEGRDDDEGPQRKVKIAPFWMGKHEVTWNEFELFMYPSQEKQFRGIFGAVAEVDGITDALARPTQPYVEMSFGMGKDGYPAISMTQHAANMYCRWLTAKTGHFYRLPTEAEWEYAARAGTTTAYFWGDDASGIDEYAWYEANSDWKYQKIGEKKPNPWGLHDILGNVAEWTLDQYAPYTASDSVLDNPFNEAVALYPRVARGGSWDHSPEDLRSATRLASDANWKRQDPQLPKSIWYHTDAQFLGFRIVRPLEVPPVEEMEKYWSSARGAR